MTKNVFTCSTDDNNEDLLTLMVNKHIRHLPVLDKDKLVGVVSIGDLVKDRTKRLKKEIDQLKSYVTKSY
jgi:predicted transcriptional regulator